MARLTLLTGGQRSGKSAMAMSLALAQSQEPVHVATARVLDGELAARVARHQQDRGEQWYNLEAPRYPSRLPLEGRVVVLDCITLWLCNIFFDLGQDPNLALGEARREWAGMMAMDSRLFVVTNEIGLGVIPADPSSRSFADLQGWFNQDLARMADSVLLMVAGLPLWLKGGMGA